VFHKFCLSRCYHHLSTYKLTLSDQTQVTLLLKKWTSDLMLIFLARPPLLGVPEKRFATGSEPAFGGPDYT